MSLARDEIFDLWAPTSSPWSCWAKPVLFAHLPQAPLEPTVAPVLPLSAPTWAPAGDGATIVVADLPGARSVDVAEALIHAGFRPVPLFNAIPAPIPARDELPGPASVVDVESIADAILVATERTGELLRALPPDALPVFLLDSERRLGRIPRPGDFDNRSVSLPTDFPSAALLGARGVTKVLLLVDAGVAFPATDLCHTLLRWQSAGMQISAVTLDDDLRAAAEPRPIRVRKPKWFRSIWHNALSVLGLRRSPLGGFGGKLPNPSTG